MRYVPILPSHGSRSISDNCYSWHGRCHGCDFIWFDLIWFICLYHIYTYRMSTYPLMWNNMKSPWLNFFSLWCVRCVSLKIVCHSLLDVLPIPSIIHHHPVYGYWIDHDIIYQIIWNQYYLRSISTHVSSTAHIYLLHSIHSSQPVIEFKNRDNNKSIFYL